MARNYSSIYNIKDFVSKEIVPKYFDMNDASEFNLGLLGYTTEMMSTLTEDSFFTVSAYMNEIFPNLAIMPESIYNYGALFQLTGNIANPAVCTTYLFVLESDIIKYGVRDGNNDSWNFYLDSDMVIDVEGVRFKPDYDIQINRKINRYSDADNKFVYTVTYHQKRYGGGYKNTISNISNQYVQSRIITYEGERYLQMAIQSHQVEKFYMNENIITSDLINLPTYTINYDGYLGNVEVFYREPNETNFIQLKKLLLGSAADKNDKFCYYKVLDDSRVEISFSSRDGYFYPKYNGEINIEYYTTLGTEGNFEIYTGSNIHVYPESKLYSYNKNILLYAIPMTSSEGGTDPIAIEDLGKSVIEKFSTVNSYTNENDLELYFKNLNLSNDSQIYFLKMRDDILRRVFSAFSLIKDSNSLIYNTNTVNLKMNYGFKGGDSDFDSDASNNTLNVIKPGTKFVYMEDSIDTLVPYKDGMDDKFVYTNPFLVLCPTNPLSVGYYLNAISTKHVLDYEDGDINTSSLVQFIGGRISVFRNPVNKDKSNTYIIKAGVASTMDLPYPMIVNDYTESTSEIGNRPYYDKVTGTLSFTDGVTFGVTESDNGLLTNSVKCLITLYRDKSRESVYGYIPMTLDLTSSNIQGNAYTFIGEITTDDEITLNTEGGSIILTNVISTFPDITQNTFAEPNERTAVSMDELFVGITTYYVSDSKTKENNNNAVWDWTNNYVTLNNPVTLIQPLDIINSSAEYKDDEVIDHELTKSSLLLKAVPMIGHDVSDDETKYMDFLSTINTQYNTLSEIARLTTTNYSIDLKFYNTYGKSRNFYVSDNIDEKLLDRVNIGIKFDIKVAFGVNTDILLSELKSFIKSYIEDINSGGMNSVYVSNLIKEIETNFPDIQYMIFRGINENEILYQGIENKKLDPTKMSRDERINFVPDYLTIDFDDIAINLL